MSTTVAPEGSLADRPVMLAPGIARTSVGGRILLTVVGIQLVALYAPTVAWLFDRWTMSVWHNAHGLLIPFAVAWFAWQELRALPPIERQASPWGAAFLIPAIGLHVLDTGMHTQILSAASIVLALPGLSLLFLGAARTQAIAFPLAFTVFMLPLPLALTEGIHVFLRKVATVATAQIVPWLGITVFSEGTTLHLVQGNLFVGDGCSGFSTLYASCAVAALAAYTSSSPRRRVLTLAAAVPVAIAANIVRIVVLVLAVEFFGMPILDTWVHPASGMMTFALALPVILWLGGPPKRANVEAAS